MTIEVEGPDGVILEFPDGTSREDMKRAMEKRYPPRPAPRRNDFERLGQNFIDGLNRGPVLSTWRNRMANPDAPRTMFENILRLAPGGQFDSAAQLSMLTPAQRRDLAARVGQPAVEAERARRAEYERVSAADPFYNSGNVVNAGVMTLLGQLGGAAADPTSWIGGGASFGARVATSAATNAGFDFITQDADTQSGVQDEYNVGQTALAAVLGGTLEGARSLPGFLVRAFEAPPPPRPAAAPDAAPAAAALPENVPEGAIVRPEVPAGARIIEDTEAGTVWELPDGAIEGEVTAGAPEVAAPAVRAPERLENGRLSVPEEAMPTPEGVAAGDMTTVERRSEFLAQEVPGLAPNVGQLRGYSAEQLRYRGNEATERLRLYDDGEWRNVSRDGPDLGDPKIFATREEAQAAADARGFEVAAREAKAAQAQPTTPDTPATPAGVGGPPPPPTRGFTPKQPPPPPPGGPGGAGPAGPKKPNRLGIVETPEQRSPSARAKKHLKERGFWGSVADMADRFYDWAISGQHPIVQMFENPRARIEQITGKPVDVLPVNDPRKLARGMQDVKMAGQQDVLFGVHPYRGLDPETHGLGAIYTALDAAGRKNGEKVDAPDGPLAQFNDYLVARTGIDEWKRREAGLTDKDPLSLDRATLEQHVKEAEAYNPHFPELADIYNDYGQAMWKKMHDSGLVSREDFDAANAARDFWAPLRRVLEEVASAAPEMSTSNKGKAFGRRKGSDKKVWAPFEALVAQTYAVNARIQQNEINGAMFRIYDDLDAVLKAVDPDAENGVMRVEKVPSRPTTISKDELAAAGIEADDAITVWRPGEINDQGRAVLYHWRDGKREARVLLDPDEGRRQYEALMGMSLEVKDLWVQTASVFATVLRSGITAHPAFIIPNYLKDQVEAWVTTDVGYLPFIDGARGAIAELGIGDAANRLFGKNSTANADLRRRYNLVGGVSGGINAEGTREIADHLDMSNLAKAGIKHRYVKDLNSFFKLTELTETGTRLGLFARTFDRAKKEGMDDFNAAIEAKFVARDLGDFGRHGSRLLVAGRIVPFLRSSIQFLEKYIRVAVADPISVVGRRYDWIRSQGGSTDDSLAAALKEMLRPLVQLGDPSIPMRREDAKALALAGKAWIKISAIIAMSTALRALYDDDEEYQQFNEYTRNTNWIFRLPNGEWAKFPKPFQTGALATAGERFYEATVMGDSKAMERMARGLFQSVMLPDSNPLGQVAVEVATNKNLHTGADIVPERTQDQMPMDQYSNWSSTFARSIADALAGVGYQVSPAVIDHTITGLFGSWGRTGQWMSNLTDPERPAMGLADAPVTSRFAAEWWRGSQDKREFFERVGGRTSELNRRLNSIKERLATGRGPAAGDLLRETDETGQLWLVSQLMGDEEGGSGVRRLHPLTRAAAINLEVSRMRNEIYGGRVMDEKDEPLPEMSARERALAEDLLEQLSVAETANLMIVTRQPGYENRNLMPRDAYVAQLREAFPGMYEELERRIRRGDKKAYSYDAVMELWPQVEGRLKQEGSGAYLGDLADEAADRSAE